MRVRSVMSTATSLLLAMTGVVGVLFIADVRDTVAGTTTVPRPDHLVIVVEENHSQTSIIGNAAAPYINSLAAQNANFTQSYALTHPSQPNYIALFAGSTNGITDDSCPNSFATANLGDELLAANLGFAGYSESLPSVGYTGCSSGSYARKHSPWVNFPSLPATSNQPFSAFPTDYSTLPEVSFVIPNLQNDMHDGTVAQGDSWLQANMSGYVDWAKTHNSLFILTFDEDDNQAGNRIATMMAGARITPGTYSEIINHYNVLRTVQDAFGLAPIGGSAAAAPILDVWTSPASDQAPAASFTSSCAGLACSFDGTGSGDADGTIASYSWNFGDGGSANDPNPTHSYIGGGSFNTTLTVADNLGSTNSVTKSVSVTSPVSAPFASDGFGRSVLAGFGVADVGGAWSLSGGAANFSVGGGAGSLRLVAASSQLTASLLSVSSADSDVSVDFSADKVATGSGVYVTVTGRRVSAGNEYRARVRIGSSGALFLQVSRLVGGVETGLVSERVVAGLTFAPGVALSVRLQVTGSSPSVVRARVWQAGSVEPGVWLVSGSDSAAVLQGPGGLAFTAYLSRGSTNAPVTVKLSNLTAKHSVF
jgi:chitodextrinase